MSRGANCSNAPVTSAGVRHSATPLPPMDWPDLTMTGRPSAMAASQSARLPSGIAGGTGTPQPVASASSSARSSSSGLTAGATSGKHSRWI